MLLPLMPLPSSWVDLIHHLNQTQVVPQKPSVTKPLKIHLASSMFLTALRALNRGGLSTLEGRPSSTAYFVEGVVDGVDGLPLPVIPREVTPPWLQEVINSV
jgi:hypothetical protein